MSEPLPVSKVELAIAEDVQPGRGWSSLMLEMADAVGAYDTLRLCEAHGGQRVYFPLDAANAPFVELLGGDKAGRLCRKFQRERLTIPTARHAIAVAKRGGVIAAVRAGRLTLAQAAAMLRLRADTVSALVKSGEGRDCAPAAAAIRRHDPRQLDMFGEVEAGAAA